MKIQGNSELNVRYYDYFNRTDRKQRAINLNSEENHVYTLTGIARNDSTWMETYHHYFFNVYSKTYFHDQFSLRRLENRHLSTFFRLFLQIVLLKSLIGIYPNFSAAINSTLSDIIGSIRDDEKLIFYIKAALNESLENSYYKFLNTIGRQYSYIESAMRVTKQISKIIEDFIKKINTNLEQIKTTEFLPKNFADKELIRFIKSSFVCISNIHIPRKSLKKQVLNEFYNINRKYVPTNIPFLKEDSSRTSQKINTIVLPKYTRQNEPVITNILNYLMFHKGQNNLQGSQYQSLLFEVIKGVFQKCWKYHKLTNHFYSFSLKDIFIDQKQLQPILSYNSLIRDAVGIKGRIKSVQMQLATEATQSVVNLEECYLEMNQRSKWIMLRKYYHPTTQSIDNSNMEDDCRQDNQSTVQQCQLFEKVHVWRLINMVYFIQNQENFTNKFYSQYSVELNKEIPPKLFYLSKYKIVVQQIYKDLQTGKLKISEILKIFPIPSSENQRLPSELKDSECSFDFRLQSLRNQLNIEDNEDSLLQTLKFQKIKSKFYGRYTLVKEIFSLLLHPKAFKKLINSIKYFIIIYISIFEEIRFKTALWQKYESFQITFDQYSKVLSQGINHVNLLEQFKKRQQNLKAIWLKIEEYRLRKDSNGRFFQHNANFYQELTECLSQNEQILNAEKCYNEINNQNISSYQKSLLLRAELRNIMKDSESIDSFQTYDEIKRSFHNVINVKLAFLQRQLKMSFKIFIETQLEKKIDNGYAFHKREDFQREEICVYYNYRLLAFINLYVNLNEQNWKYLEHYFKPLLVERACSSREIENMMSKIKFIGDVAKIQYNRPKEYISEERQ